MENNLLFPSAATLLRKGNEEPSETSGQRLLDGSEFSSFALKTPNSYSENEEIACKRTTTTYLPAHNHAIPCDIKSSEDEYSSWESDDCTENKKRKHKRHKHHKKKKKKRCRSKEDECCKEDSRKSSRFNVNIDKPDTIWLHETKLDTTNAFRNDSRSDQDNYQFTSLYKKDIADFHPLIHCRCLGLGKRQSITLYPEKVKRKKRKSNILGRYFNTVRSSTDELQNDKFVNVVESEDFIPLVNNSCTNIPLVNNTKESENENKRSDETSDPSSGNTCLQRNRYFSQKLSENPFNIDMWLTFVDYQDELTLNEDNEAFTQSPKAIVEKKTSILEKAMISNPLSTKLILKYMHLVNDIWTHDKIKKWWKDVLFKIPHRCILWRHYCLYLQSDMLSMKVTAVVDAYRKAFRMLIGIYNGTVQSHQAEENAEEELLLIFLQMVIFLWQAGYTEKAACLLQCLVEFNNFCPVDLVNEDNHQMKLTKFERFFESDLPRFGTSEARGWNQTMGDPQIGKNTPSLDSFPAPYTSCPEIHFDEELEKLQNNKKSKKDIWMLLENVRSANEFLPFRGNHDDCEDTERVVLYDDVSFSLFRLSSSELKFQLLLAFLLLLGVPVSRQFLNQKVSLCFSVYCLIEEATAACSCFCHSPVFSDHVKVDSVLLDERTKRPNHKVITTARTIISQYLSHLRTEKYARKLSQLWFHFESFLFRCEFEKSEEFEKRYWVGMKKFVKRLLKMECNRSCVSLWCMYALHEWNLGNTTDAKRVFSTALQMSHADKDDTIIKVAKIIRILVDIQLDWKTYEENDSIPAATKSKILNVYLAFLDSNRLLQHEEETPNPISLLKVYNMLTTIYTSVRDQVKKGDVKSVDFLSCYLVFVYLFQGLGSLIQLSDELIVKSNKRVDLSDTFSYALLLMRCDNTSESFKAYKHLLEKCFKVYPEKRTFSMLFNALKQFGLGSRNARMFYEDAMKKSGGDMRPWFYAIHYEERRIEHMTFVPGNTVDMTTSLPGNSFELQFECIDAQSGIHNRIRSLYNKMLRMPNLKYCSAIWIRFLLFQLKYGSEKQANDTLYTALKNCPGVKSLYLFACEQFDEKFEEMLNLMEEKEVRIKLIVEELDILLEV